MFIKVLFTKFHAVEFYWFIEVRYVDIWFNTVINLIPSQNFTLFLILYHDRVTDQVIFEYLFWSWKMLVFVAFGFMLVSDLFLL